MIVCSCNIVTRNEIEEVVHALLEKDAWQLITVGMVYHAMEKRGKCCGCFPNAISIIVEAVEVWHRHHDTPDSQIIPFVLRTREMLERQDSLRRGMRAQFRAA